MDERHSEADRTLFEARLAAIITSSDDVIVSKTLDGTIMSWNRAAERILGWTAAEAIGQNIKLIVPTDRHAEEDDVLARLGRGERVEHFETVRQAKDGRLIDMSITVSPIQDAMGRVVGASKVGRDITDRRRLEEQRALLLKTEQEARRRAEAHIQAKDEMLATVSHELRTPLNAIFGWARLLQSGELDDAGRARAVSTILRSATAQARLVEDLLDLSRLTAGRMRLDFEAIGLNAIIEAALETVRPAAAAKGITITTAFDDSLGLVQGDPDRLQQVVWNLVMNSVKFTPPGGRVDISSHRATSAARIVVKDSGQGIAADALPYIFEPFRQEDSRSSRSEGGLGLGLALVRRLIDLHGGDVVAESAGKGQGTTITVTLPTLQQTPHSAGETQEALRGPIGRPALGGMRILVVDDDREFLDLATLILRRAGAEVRGVASAARAYDVVESWLPNVLLSDLAMPGEDGFVLASAMKAIFAERRAQVSLIAITAYGTSEARARAATAGFDRYLTKPVDPISLPGVVAEVVGRRA